jgi:hypothetical protein
VRDAACPLSTRGGRGRCSRSRRGQVSVETVDSLSLDGCDFIKARRARASPLLPARTPSARTLPCPPRPRPPAPAPLSAHLPPSPAAPPRAAPHAPRLWRPTSQGRASVDRRRGLGAGGAGWRGKGEPRPRGAARSRAAWPSRTHSGQKRDLFSHDGHGLTERLVQPRRPWPHKGPAAPRCKIIFSRQTIELYHPSVYLEADELRDRGACPAAARALAAHGYACYAHVAP